MELAAASGDVNAYQAEAFESRAGGRSPRTAADSAGQLEDGPHGDVGGDGEDEVGEPST